MEEEIRRGKERNEGEGRRNQARKRRNQGAEMGKKSEGSTEGKRNPAKVRLASRKGNSQGPEAPTHIHRSPGSSKRYLQSNKTVFPF